MSSSTSSTTTNNNNTSTLGSYASSAKGALQSVVGAITGSEGDKVRPSSPPSSLAPLTPAPQSHAATTQSHAQSQHEASHSVSKLGPVSLSPSTGAIATDDPDRSQGKWDQTMGSGKEMLGNMVGSDALKREGVEQNRKGQAMEARGQLSDLGGGMGDRAGGKVEGVLAGLSGDREAEARARARHDVGKTLQRSAERDIGRSA